MTTYGVGHAISADEFAAATARTQAILTGSSATTDSSSITTTESVVHTAPSAVWANGRVYRVQLAGRFSGSGGSAGVTLRIRKGTTTGGTQLCDFGIVLLPTNFPYAPGPMLLANNSGADITTQVCATAQSAAAGTATWNGSASSPRGFYVIDVGAYSDFAGLAPIAFIT